MTHLSDLYWPSSLAREGLELLARAAGHPVGAGSIVRAPGASAALDQVLRAAAMLGLDAEPVDISVGEVESLLRSAGPAVVRIDDDALVMLVGCRGRTVRVVQPDHRVATVPLDALCRALVEPQAAPLVPEVQRLVEETGVRRSRRANVVRALVAERLRLRRLHAGWLIRIPSGASFGAQLVAAGARRRVILLALAHAAQYACWIGAWWLLGRAALQGHLDPGWLGAWILALFCFVALQLLTLWLQGRIAIQVGALLKQRLLAGAFQLEPEEIRSEGAGQLLGRVIEAEAVESTAVGGGVIAVLACVELILAAGVLAIAAPLLSLLLLIWTGVTVALTVRYCRRRAEWVGLRVGLTHDLIERMLGHRTRLAQQPREQWHDGEDRAIERYWRASAVMDRAAVWLVGMVPRGWVVVGLCGLAPIFITQPRPASLAIGLGGILLAFRALHRLTGGLSNLTGVAIAWRQIAPVFRAATRDVPAAPPDLPSDMSRCRNATASQARPAAPLLEALNLRFTHAGRSVPVLRGCSLAIAPGERVILQGASGGGKSTLAAILAGLRKPQSGLVLLDGLDRYSVGRAGWRRRVILVPPFHENHLILGSVAFNALMGVEWPPGESDLGRVDAVLRELGLGEALDRMPSGLLQTIGETGWQLSHGERSRLYLARALLQNPDVLILDESFAQLDPENVHLALDAVVSRAGSVLLVAHPDVDLHANRF